MYCYYSYLKDLVIYFMFYYIAACYWFTCVPLHQLQTRLGKALHVDSLMFCYISCRRGWARRYMTCRRSARWTRVWPTTRRSGNRGCSPSRPTPPARTRYISRNTCDILQHWTVKSTYKEPAYKELPVIRNWFSFPNRYQGNSSLYVDKKLQL